MARLDKLVADAKAAEGEIKDDASFKAELPKIMGNCGACHKEYRRPPKQ
jgi:cytochrome c556